MQKDSGLSKIALAWMASEAIAAGLLIDTQRLDLILGRQGGGYAPADPKATLHDSLSWAWWPAEYVPKRQWDRVQCKEVWRVNRFRRRAMGPSPLVHSSAWEVSNMPQPFPAMLSGSASSAQAQAAEGHSRTQFERDTPGVGLGAEALEVEVELVGRRDAEQVLVG